MKKYLYIIIPIVILASVLALRPDSLKFFASVFGVRTPVVGDLTAQAAASRTGLVGHWTMDANDINGTTVYDKSGSKNTAVLVGGPTPTIMAGKINQALNFSTGGTGTAVASSTAALPTGATSRSMFGWIKGAFVASRTGLFGYGSAATGQMFVLTASADGTGRLYFIGYSADFLGTKNVLDNNWHSVGATYDGTTVKLYVDGSLDNQSDKTLSTGTAYPMRIGSQAYPDGANYYYFNGSIDDVRIYNRALSATEVAQLYSSAKTSYAQSPQRASSTPVSGGKLVGWWTMDANDMSTTGATLYDKSGQNNHGTVTGTTTSTGKIGQARSFSGTNNISVASNASINFGNENFTVGAWIKATACDGGYERIFSRASDNWELGISAGLNSCNISIYDGTWRDSATALYSKNQWTHIVVTRTGTNYVIYVNGVGHALAGASRSITGSLTIGAYSSGGSVFPGAIDDVRIYNYAMSAQEVSNLYNSAKQSYVGATVRRTGLVLDLNFGNNDAQSAPKVYDTSGFNRHTTSTAATAPTCNEKFCNFDGINDNMNIDGSGISALTTFSFAFKFNPNFAHNDGASHYFVYPNPYLSFYVRKHTTDSLQIYFNTEASGFDITSATLGRYWKKNQENILIFSGISGNTSIWLNGSKIVNQSTTAWTLPTVRQGGGIQISGKLYYFKAWNRLLTDAEVGILSADRQTNVK